MGLQFEMGALDPILESSDVKRAVDEAAEAVAAASGPGYEAQPAPYLGRRRGGGGRWRSSVVTESRAAMRDNAANQTLLKAIDRA